MWCTAMRACRVRAQCAECVCEWWLTGAVTVFALAGQRASVIRELTMTENKYLVSLRITTADYLQPLLAKAGKDDEILSADLIRVIFSGSAMEAVEALSKRLLVDFTRRTMRLTYWTQVGDVFLQYSTQLSCYADYVTNYDVARKALGEALERNNGKLANFDRAVQAKHGIKLGIRDFLIMPVQRVPRYILLLKDILKHTPVAHADHKGEIHGTEGTRRREFGCLTRVAAIVEAQAMLQRFTVHMDMEAQRAESMRIMEAKLAGIDVRQLMSVPGECRLARVGPCVRETTHVCARVCFVGLQSAVCCTKARYRKRAKRKSSTCFYSQTCSLWRATRT